MAVLRRRLAMAGEETDAYEGREGAETLTEYEKQRLARIRENEARLEALGLRGLAASPLLRNPSPAAAAAARRKQKKRSANEDDEYLPSEESGGEEESSSESGQDDEMDGESKSSSRSSAKGKKKKLLNSAKTSKSTTSKGSTSFADFVDDDTALQQAIALSLAGSSERSMTTTGAETSGTGMEGSDGTPHKKNSKASIQDSANNRKIKKLGKSRIQLTEDDVVAFFFSIDEVGKGYITPWDLEKMATINDFIWADSEISNMIRCFDSDGDGKINLEDFRSIVSRCNMLQEPDK